jgi:hypothetical protein
MRRVSEGPVDIEWENRMSAKPILRLGDTHMVWSITWLRGFVITLAYSVALSAIVPAGGLRADEPYISDIPRKFSAAYANWTKSLPYAIKLANWLTKFEGVVSPIRDVTISGARLKFGTVCVPHDCGDNIAGILFTLQQDRIVAVVQLHGQNNAPTTMVIGQMTSDEFACIRRFTDNYELVIC